MRLRILSLICGVALCMPSAYADAPVIVSTIGPIHALVAAVTKHRTIPHLLLPKNASPHHYSLTPSNAKMLANADVIVRIHPEFETFLDAALSHNKKAKDIVIGDFPGLTILPTRHLHLWFPEDKHHGDHHDHDHQHHNHDDHDHHHDHGPTDWHIWLSVANATVIVEQLAEKLGDLDPEYKDLYKSNAATMVEKLKLLDETISRTLLPLQEVPFLVFHDAYQYMDTHYHLKAVGALMVSPDANPGPKTVSKLIAHVKEMKAQCIFEEPQFSNSLVKLIQREYSIKSATLDPLWTDAFEDSTHPEDGYPALMMGLVSHMKQCFVDAF